MKKLILFIGMIFIFISPVLADGNEDPCHFSTEGTDFWFGFMQNRSNYAGHYLEITVTSRVGADFTITYGPNETPFGGIYTVGPNSSKSVLLDYGLMESLGSEIIDSKGIHLVAKNPVNVYALNYRLQSADVAVIYPTVSLGKEYFAMCYSPRYTSGNESNSEFLIVATEDSTSLQFFFNFQANVCMGIFFLCTVELKVFLYCLTDVLG